MKTLGNYRDFCVAIGADKAVAFFDQKIEREGRDELVLADESQMLQLIYSMMGEEKE